MKKILVLMMLFSLNAMSVEMNTISIWKGYNQMEQNQNLVRCNAELSDLRICSSNWSEHGQAVYDVALMEAAKTPTKTLSLYKGYGQQDQNRNLKSCKQAAQFGQLCVTSLWIHKAAAYDVALME